MVQNMGLDPLCFVFWVCEVEQEPTRKGWREERLGKGRLAQRHAGWVTLLWLGLLWDS